MESKDKKKPSMREVLLNTFVSLLLTFLFAFTVIGIGICVFHLEIGIGGITLTLGLLGTILAFVGNNLIASAAGRWGMRNMPQWKWGNYLQSVGFALTIAALLIDN